MLSINNHSHYTEGSGTLVSGGRGDPQCRPCAGHIGARLRQLRLRAAQAAPAAPQACHLRAHGLAPQAGARVAVLAPAGARHAAALDPDPGPGPLLNAETNTDEKNLRYLPIWGKS